MDYLENISMQFHLLFVDENPEHHKAFDAIPKSVECRIYHAYTAKEALEYMLEHDFDFLVLSADMEEMSGLEMIHLVQKDDALSSIPFMFTTGEQHAVSYEALYEAGAVVCIPFAHLPFQLPNLMHLFRTAQYQMHKLKCEIDTTVKISITDQLTGAFNRYKFDDEVKNQIARYARYDQPFSIILLDIDHFKSINDTYGHAAGDRVLVEIAQLIMDGIRDLDHFFRMGGEEFVILLEDTKAHGAMILAEELRKTIQAFLFNHKTLKVTSSFGVAEYRENESIETLVDRADKALYVAKEGGRNRVVAS
jgi:diguanylate cyclase (GGDEF)-like protein